MANVTESERPAENRYTRRRRMRLNGSIPEPLVYLYSAVDTWKDSTFKRNRMIDGMDKGATLAERIYSEGSIIGAYINDARNVSLALKGAKRFEVKDPEIARFAHQRNPFTQRIRGASLTDIEELPYPLTREGLITINRFLRFSYVSRFTLSNTAQMAQEIAVTLPALNTIYPKEGLVTSQLKPLCDRMTAYFDFFSDFITSTHISPTQEIEFLSVAAFASRSLWRGLGCFLPGRLGITPSSTAKLFDGKIRSGFDAWAWEMLKKELTKELHGAFLKDKLPEELHKYLLYDTQANQEAAMLLQPYYQQLAKDSFERAHSGDQNEPLIRLHSYQKALRADMLNAPEKFLRFPLTHPVIREVLVASQYKQSLILIVRFRNSPTHLTLDINERGKIYGIPAALLREDPHIGDLLAKDLLGPILEYGRRRHPGIESVPKAVIRMPLRITQKPPPDLIVNGDDYTKYIAEKPLKRKRLVRLFQEPKLPERVEQREPRFQVNHSRSQVEELTGGKLPEKMTDRVMEAIKMFEWGEKTAKDLTDIQGYYRIRVGDYRIFLYHMDGKKYDLDKIKHRSKAYEGL